MLPYIAKQKLVALSQFRSGTKTTGLNRLYGSQ